MKLNITAIALVCAFSASMVHAAETAPQLYGSVAEQPTDVKDREIAGLFDRWNTALQT